MEWTDIVTVKLTDEGAHLLINYAFANTLDVDLKNEELLDQMIFYGGDEYKTYLWKLFRVFGNPECNPDSSTVFTDLHKVEE